MEVAQFSNKRRKKNVYIQKRASVQSNATFNMGKEL